jgi:hypothetical protein
MQNDRKSFFVFFRWITWVQCFFRSKVRHENIYMKILLECVGDLPHMKKSVIKRIQFWENPFLGTVPTAFKALFVTNSLQRAKQKIESKWVFLNNPEVSSYLLGHILLFWKVSMPNLQWPPKINWISRLWRIGNE